MSDEREKGIALFREVYGDEAADGMAHYLESTDFGVEIARWTADFCFGKVWTRGGLERRMRSCVVLGMMIALRQESEIGYHTRMGLANGLTPAEIEEILYTTVPYCGFPAANGAKAAMRKVLDEHEHKQPGVQKG
ncbi:MAG: carboxymuconolactone decarboxylase family protein [Sphingomonadales bacterium]|nr:carboxymuconolactone decarboxylase family protein [Sphingomonadales bacterium]